MSFVVSELMKVVETSLDPAASGKERNNWLITELNRELHLSKPDINYSDSRKRRFHALPEAQTMYMMNDIGNIKLSLF